MKKWQIAAIGILALGAVIAAVAPDTGPDRQYYLRSAGVMSVREADDLAPGVYRVVLDTTTPDVEVLIVRGEDDVIATLTGDGAEATITIEPGDRISFVSAPGFSGKLLVYD